MYILLYVQKSVHDDDACRCNSLTFMLLYVQESVHDDDTCTIYIVHAVIQESVHDDDTCTMYIVHAVHCTLYMYIVHAVQESVHDDDTYTCQGTGAEASSRLSPRCKGDTVTRAF